jgi:hypothetical protein
VPLGGVSWLHNHLIQINDDWLPDGLGGA